MKKIKVGGERNYGFGRSMKFALRNVLQDRYGPGRYGTKAAMKQRGTKFLAFLASRHIDDFRQVMKADLDEYSAHLKQEADIGSLNQSTAVNLLSSANVIMQAIRGDKELWLSPARSIGRRVYVRSAVPTNSDVDEMSRITSELLSRNERPLCAVVILARHLGLRFREASLLDVRTALREARRLGRVKVWKGTKGGRRRELEASEPVIAALEQVASILGEQQRVVRDDTLYVHWLRYAYRAWVRVRSHLGTRLKLHELRAAFACDMYFDLAGVKAPVYTEGVRIDASLDKVARFKIAGALGHGRAQIASAYIGTQRRAPETS